MFHFICIAVGGIHSGINSICGIVDIGLKNKNR